MEIFVLIVDESGVPGRMFGPFASFDNAGDKIISLLQAEQTEITQDIRDCVDLNGMYEYDDGGGIYMIQAE